MSVARIYASVSHWVGRLEDVLTDDVAAWNRASLGVSSLFLTVRQRKHRSQEGAPHAVSLCSSLLSTLTRQCTDQRDRVYALYGMSGEDVVKQLPVDYEEPIDALSLRVSCYFVNNGNVAWMLTHARGLTSDGPSWTLDLVALGHKEACDPLACLMHSDGQNDTYSAGGVDGPICQLDAAGSRLSMLGTIVTGLSDIPEGLLISYSRDQAFGMGEDLGSYPVHALTNIRTLHKALTWLDQNEDPMDESNDAFWRTLIADYNPFEDNNNNRDPETGRTRPGFGTYFQELLAFVRCVVLADPPLDVHNLSPSDVAMLQMPPNATQYWGAITSPYMDRRIARTNDGSLTLVPKTSQTSDVVAVFQGVAVPFILRKGENDTYQVVGTCYVHGLMDGKIFEGEPQLEYLVLV